MQGQNLVLYRLVTRKYVVENLEKINPQVMILIQGLTEMLDIRQVEVVGNIKVTRRDF